MEGNARHIRQAFIFIGANPNTGWLPSEVALDAKGFILSGRDIDPGDLVLEAWPRRRQPCLLETSVPGLSTAGHVRSGSTKCVASAVGEGLISVSFIHRVLAE